MEALVILLLKVLAITFAASALCTVCAVVGRG